MASLNIHHGSSTRLQRQALHRLKRRKGWSDAELHDAIGMASTTHLSARQASDAIKRLSGVDLPNPPGQQPSVYQGSKPDGTVRMITADQIQHINRLGGEYFGDVVEFLAWLTKNFKIPWRQPRTVADFDGVVRHLATAKRASQVIVVLKNMIYRRNQKKGIIK